MDGVEGEDEIVAASDHYAVTLDIEFRCNGDAGGRHDRKECLRDSGANHRERREKRGRRRRP